MLKASIIPYSLNFLVPGGTSRGILRSKDTFILKIESGSKIGYGECALFKGLSVDDRPNYELKLEEVTNDINNEKNLSQILEGLKNWPSIQFGIEVAFRSLHSKNPFYLFDNKFSNRKSGIEINGLVWMGEWEYMKEQLREKLKSGFTCIKIKIGAIDFDRELDLLRKIRQDYAANEVEIRVDANGAFTSNNVLQKLEQLSKYTIHSIEQPIKQGQLEEMAKLCENPIIPIALDEELIGVIEYEKKRRILEQISPQYIILKPALIGGFSGSDEWIELAEDKNIGWWLTSALESNIGLNALAQYIASKNTAMPQGLGTGQLFSNNFPSPLELQSNHLWYRSNDWDLSLLGS